MISVDEARARIVSAIRATPAEQVGLSEAWGRVLAIDIAARLTQPPADMSAMDGYAIGACPGAVGDELRVIGESAAGHPFTGTLGAHQAVRIFTGSVLPAGTHAILIQEDATREGDRLRINEALAPGKHVRPAGQDFRRGETLLSAGKRLGARDIGLAAAGNHAWLAVHRRPLVGILATGDEIFLPGEDLPPGGIVSSNSHALAALVRAAGAEPVVLPIARDEIGEIIAAVSSAARFDLLITTGGASVGDHDLVQAALKHSGMELDFWRIAMRPGKPLMFGQLRDMPVIGLPGNPVSALVCAILFVLPAIAALSGLPGEAPATVAARLAVPLSANDRRADYLRSTLSTEAGGTLRVSPFPRQDSSQLKLLASADALTLRAPHAPAAAAGDEVRIIRLAGFGI